MKKTAAVITFLVALIALPEFYIHFKEYLNEHGGTISMWLMNRQVSNNDERNIFVCVSDDAQELKHISITPVYDNSSEYPVTGFDLRYSLELANGEAPNANNLFDLVSTGDNAYQYKYKENSLPQYSQTYEPFHLSDFPVRDSYYLIKSKASYSGSPYPYIYTVNLWMRIVPKRKGQSLEDWKLACKNVINGVKAQHKQVLEPESFDRFYCCDGQVYNEFGKDFGSVSTLSVAPEQPKENIDVKPAPSAQPAPSDEPAQQNSSTPASTSDEALQYTAFSTYTQNGVSYLKLTANQVLDKTTRYYVVYKVKDVDWYLAESFMGTGTNEVAVKLYEEREIDYVTVPTEDASLLSKVSVEKENDRTRVSSNADKRIVVVYSGYGYESAVAVEKNGYFTTTALNIKVKKTLTFIEKPKSFWNDGILIMFIILFVPLVIYGGWMIYASFAPDCEDKWGLRIMGIVVIGIVLIGVLIEYFI